MAELIIHIPPEKEALIKELIEELGGSVNLVKKPHLQIRKRKYHPPSYLENGKPLILTQGN